MTVTGWPYPIHAQEIVIDEPEEQDKAGIYHLFAGFSYYPDGGMGDYLGSFSTLKDAFARYEEGDKSDHEEFDWGHIATIQGNALVLFLEYREDDSDDDDNMLHVGWKKPRKDDDE